MSLFSGLSSKNRMISKDEALVGRNEPIHSGRIHSVLGTVYHPPFDQNYGQLVVGMGCFWGVERLFWQVEGVITTAVGYCGGYTPNPTYEEVCSGSTAHNEVVLIVFDTQLVSDKDLLKLFWENHDPSQGLRQGNDRGSQYRSGIYCTSAKQLADAKSSLKIVQPALSQIGMGDITTEIKMLDTFYYAEVYHQQYLHKNPNGYCALKGVGIKVVSL